MMSVTPLQRQVATLRSAVDRMQSEVGSLEKEQRARRTSFAALSLFVAVAIAVLASFAFAQTSSVEQRRFPAPFVIVDKADRPILVVKADPAGRGVYFYDNEGNLTAYLASTPDGAGGVVKVLDANATNTYVALGAFPGALGCIVRRDGKQLAFAGKNDSGKAVVQVFDPPSEIARVQLSNEGMGRVEIRNAGDNVIAVLKKAQLGGGAVGTWDADGGAAFAAYGSGTGGDVCVWNHAFGEKCLGPEP